MKEYFYSPETIDDYKKNRKKEIADFFSDDSDDKKTPSNNKLKWYYFVLAAVVFAVAVVISFFAKRYFESSRAPKLYQIVVPIEDYVTVDVEGYNGYGSIGSVELNKNDLIKYLYPLAKDYNSDISEKEVSDYVYRLIVSTDGFLSKEYKNGDSVDIEVSIKEENTVIQDVQFVCSDFEWTISSLEPLTEMDVFSNINISFYHNDAGEISYSINADWMNIGIYVDVECTDKLVEGSMATFEISEQSLTDLRNYQGVMPLETKKEYVVNSNKLISDEFKTDSLLHRSYFEQLKSECFNTVVSEGSKYQTDLEYLGSFMVPDITSDEKIKNVFVSLFRYCTYSGEWDYNVSYAANVSVDEKTGQLMYENPELDSVYVEPEEYDNPEKIMQRLMMDYYDTRGYKINY